MYDDHVPTISAAMRDNPDTFVRGITFVLLSIRQRIYNVPAALADVDEYRGKSIYLLGHKRAGYTYCLFNGPRLYSEVLACGDDTEAAIGILLQVPDLGIVKAAFVAQLLGFDVACIDSRNAKALGTSQRAWRTDGKSPGQLAPKVSSYLNQYGGRAREFWNTWCEDVAAAYPTAYADAQAVSAEHLEIVPDDFIPF